MYRYVSRNVWKGAYSDVIRARRPPIRLVAVLRRSESAERCQGARRAVRCTRFQLLLRKKRAKSENGNGKKTAEAKSENGNGSGKTTSASETAFRDSVGGVAVVDRRKFWKKIGQCWYFFIKKKLGQCCELLLKTISVNDAIFLFKKFDPCCDFLNKKLPPYTPISRPISPVSSGESGDGNTRPRRHGDCCDFKTVSIKNWRIGDCS
jgi:hypothetical protein